MSHLGEEASHGSNPAPDDLTTDVIEWLEKNPEQLCWSARHPQPAVVSITFFSLFFLSGAGIGLMFVRTFLQVERFVIVQQNADIKTVNAVQFYWLSCLKFCPVALFSFTGCLEV